ncbi:MAG: DUF4252 domain-containing protein [Prevotella sp.]|jgi:hypothetical protein|nr:DUF4252 domain-containing protein [Prevotella sp.]
MKKYLICLVLVIALSQTAYSQSVDKLLNTVSKAENVDKVKIGRFLMFLGKSFGGVGNMPVVRGVHSMEVYDMSSCATNLRRNLTDQIGKLKDGEGYETLISVKDKKDNVRILMKKKKDVISDMVILCLSDDDPAIVRFSGKIKEADIAELVQKYDK